MGIKHKAIAQIFSFQQREHETVRDCVNRLKQYIVCCLDDEKPSQARLISIFLEGLKNWTLYTHLYACRHMTFNDCCIDAMDFDDNFDASSQDNKIRQTSHFVISSSRDPNLYLVVDVVPIRLSQTYKPHYDQMAYQ